MFERYDKLNPSYIPDNTTPKQDFDYATVEKVVPEIAYSAKGTPIGYKWNFGEEFELKFSAATVIKVAEDSLVYEISAVGPTPTTRGIRGQQAYNIIDCKSWTCVGSSGGFYIWIEDDELIYPTEGTKQITLVPYTQGKELQVQFYNTRWELIYSLVALDAADVYLQINKETSEIFKPGVYYSVLKLAGDNDVSILDKQMLIVL